MTGPRRGIMWFRRDLRLRDQPALRTALDDADETVAAFVVDDRLWRPAGDHRRWFLAGCLRALDRDLGERLVVRTGDPAVVLPALADEVGADEVVCTEDFGPYGRRRDDAVAAALADRGRALRRVDSPYAVRPGDVVASSGRPYHVFSAFRRAWREHDPGDPWLEPPEPLPLVADLASDGIPEVARPAADLPEPGEHAARRRLEAFLRTDAPHYGEERDRPDLDRTSRLSPYLKWGCLHPRQVLARLDRRRKGHEPFESEVTWREFYGHVLAERPDSARRSWREELADMEVDVGADADRRFAAWAEGRTGYPIVDAGMRQLRAEGWMHNRVRMVVASFLVKDLHLDWGRGARHFMRWLVDGDLASNSHGWQWVAGTGTDAAPYFRIFNPVRQSERFDPDGDYIRRWVPELAGLPADVVHAPWEHVDGPPPGYPGPIVDHRVEREEALARYGRARG